MFNVFLLNRIFKSYMYIIMYRVMVFVDNMFFLLYLYVLNICIKRMFVVDYIYKFKYIRDIEKYNL